MTTHREQAQAAAVEQRHRQQHGSVDAEVLWGLWIQVK
jgi:hypothetical protein